MTYRRSMDAIHDRIAMRLKRRADDERQPVRQDCAWCGGIIRPGRLVDGKASHGICPTCAVKFRKEAGL